MTSSIVTITKQAWRKMDQILQSSSCKHGFLYSVSSGGCNGFNFQLHLMKEGDKRTFDENETQCHSERSCPSLCGTHVGTLFDWHQNRLCFGRL